MPEPRSNATTFKEKKSKALNSEVITDFLYSWSYSSLFVQDRSGGWRKGFHLRSLRTKCFSEYRIQLHPFILCLAYVTHILFCCVPINPCSCLRSNIPQGQEEGFMLYLVLWTAILKPDCSLPLCLANMHRISIKWTVTLFCTTMRTDPVPVGNWRWQTE